MNKLSLLALATLVFASTSWATQLYYVEDTNDTLHTFDTTTFQDNLVGALGVAGDFGDLAYDTTSGVMYYVGGRNDRDLYTVNLVTGAATLVGAHAIPDMFGLGFDGAGNLYATDSASNFYSMNKSTGAATLIGNTGIYPGGLDWDSANGQMILQAAGGSTYSINLGSGAATLLSSAGFVNDDDIAYDVSDNSFWVMDWSGQLYHYDSAWNRTNPFSGSFVTGAVETAQSVPEPMTLAVLGIGAAAMARRRRK